MRKLDLNWSDYIKYTSTNVGRVFNKPGVYKISILQNDGSLAVRYVGQTDDLNRRLYEHLDVDNEKNQCLREKLSKYDASFSVAVITSQEDRNGAELALYNHYKPTCNDPKAIPNGPALEINYKK